MFLESLTNLKNIIDTFSTTIFVIDPETELTLSPAIKIVPETPSSLISIDDVREMIALTGTKQTKELYFIIKYAEQLTDSASNAILKTAEEPGNHIHIIMLTTHPSRLLSTIRSRSMLFYIKKTNSLSTPPSVSPEIMDYAKKLLVADKSTLLTLAEELSKKKAKKTDGEADSDKSYILKVIETTIELAYKSYFKTKNQQFLKKINGLSTAYDNIARNGNKKLQLVANLI